MLSVTHLGQFGQLGVDPTPAEEAQIPGFISIGELAQDAEQRLLRAYTKIMLAVQIAGPNTPIPVALLRKYMGARTAVIDAADIWIKARDKTPKAYLPDPDAQPTLPPSFQIPAGSGFAGPLGQTFVRARDVQVTFGPQGSERVTSLSDPEAALAGTQLGAFPIVALFWVFGLAIVGTCVVLAIREFRSADVAASRAISDQARARAQEVESDAASYAASLQLCQTFTDPQMKLKCLEAAGKNIGELKKDRPKTAKPGSLDALGLFGTIGLIALAGAAGVVGYAVYRQKRDRGMERPAARSRPALVRETEAV